MSVPADCEVYRVQDLLPSTWQAFIAAGPVRTFNPGLLRDGDGWIFAYRVVGADGLRRIGVCRLDGDLKVKPGSAVALTDHVRFRRSNEYPEVVTSWFADPRLYRFGGRVYIYWNSGWHEPRNYQFVQELEPISLLPIGPPREMVLAGARQKLEKNWTLFTDANGELRIVYSITPHRVLAVSLAGDADIRCEEIARTEWKLEGYPVHHGGMRGGSPPFLHDGQYWSFGHTVHDGSDGYDYVPAAYAFAPHLPYTPTMRPVQPMTLAPAVGDERKYPRLNPAVNRVIYPCGAAHDGTRWIISHGINDEQCAVSRVGHEAVLRTVVGC